MGMFECYSVFLVSVQLTYHKIHPFLIFPLRSPFNVGAGQKRIAPGTHRNHLPGLSHGGLHTDDPLRQRGVLSNLSDR